MLRDRQTDGRMDRRKKWHIEVGAPPKKTLVTVTTTYSEELLNLVAVTKT